MVSLKEELLASKDVELTVDEFYQLKLKELKRFINNWKLSSKVDPHSYPLYLMVGDWEEQLAIYGEQGE